MSSLIVDVVKILDVEPHPNADRLDIATVKGWKTVVGKDQYKVGDLVVYAPIDSVLPIELADEMKVTQYLTKLRVKTAKLRGVFSQGLCIPVEIVANKIVEQGLDERKASFETEWLGKDVKDILGITKFEPPEPIAEDALAQPTAFAIYTDIENIKNYPDVFTDEDDVIVTEKIHGVNSRFGIVEGEFMVGSHNQRFKKGDNKFWNIAKKYNIEDKLRGYIEDWSGFTKGDLIVYGEVYGTGVQKGKLNYDAIEEKKFRVFGVKVDGKYMSYPDFKIFCLTRDFERAPELYIGKFHKGLLDLANGQSTLGNHIKEGIVITSVVDSDQKDGWYHLGLGRQIVKHISEKYLLGDHGDAH